MHELGFEIGPDPNIVRNRGATHQEVKKLVEEHKITD